MKNTQIEMNNSKLIDVPQHTFPDGDDEILTRRQKRAIKRALNPKKNRRW